MSDGEFLRTSCGSPNYAAPEVISGRCVHLYIIITTCLLSLFKGTEVVGTEYFGLKPTLT